MVQSDLFVHAELIKREKSVKNDSDINFMSKKQNLITYKIILYCTGLIYIEIAYIFH